VAPSRSRIGQVDTDAGFPPEPQLDPSGTWNALSRLPYQAPKTPAPSPIQPHRRLPRRLELAPVDLLARWHLRPRDHQALRNPRYDPGAKSVPSGISPLAHASSPLTGSTRLVGYQGAVKPMSGPVGRQYTNSELSEEAQTLFHWDSF